MKFQRMRFFVALVALFFCVELLGQNLTVVDSLKRQLTASNAERKFALLNAIGFEYRYSHPDSTMYYCEQAYELGVSIDLQKGLSKPLSFMGLANAYKGDYKRALDYHAESILVAEAQQDTIQLAYAYNNLGRMFFDQGDLVRSYDNLIRSKEIFEAINDPTGLAYVYRSLSHVFKSQSEYSEALVMSKRALELRKQLGNPRELASAYMEYGLVYQAMKDTKTALAKFVQADSVASRLNDKVTKAEIRLGMAEILVEEKKYDEAFNATSDVFDAISESTNRKLFLRASIIRGKYYFNRGDDARAILILNDIMSEKNSGTPFFQRDASLVLHEIYKRKRNFEVADSYLTHYKMLDESLENQDLTTQVERLLFQLQIEKKEKENETLKATQLKNEALISEQHFQNTLLVITVISIGGLAFLLWTSTQRRKLINHRLALQNQQINFQREEITRQNENLSKRNHQLSELNNEKDTLMNIVAHDLKAPLNRISGLTELIDMSGGVPGPSKEYFNLLKDSTKAGLEMIIDLLDVNALEMSGSEPEYSSFDLAQYITEKAKAFEMAAEVKKITITLNAVPAGEVSSDPNYISRILDNLISNAIKFSPRKSVISLSAEVVDYKIVLSVKDQGPGFSAEDKRLMFQKFRKLSARPTGGESSNGLGLAIVKTLVDRLDGEIELNTGQGKGSEFVVWIPDRRS